MKKWSEDAWEAAAPVYEKILQLPFIKELADGTLSREKFIFYLKQDALYIDNYARVLSHIASRLTDKGHMARFISFAGDSVAVEQAMHDTYLRDDYPSAGEMSPSCLLYTSVLSAQATAPVEVEAAAVLPCFWVYQRVGSEIYRRTTADNPYKMWIDTYGDPSFEEYNNIAISICDELAAKAGEETRRRMTELFVLCTKMEWQFWDSAWNLEKWKI